MAKLSEFGEKELVSRLIRAFDSQGIHSLGDDCAILDQGSDFLLMTTDMVNEATHIPKGSKSQDIGWFAAAVNLSDIAAMGGAPIGMLFALGLPRETDLAWLDGLAAGIRECCETYQTPVLGGDTKENQSITISGTAFGRVPRKQILRRSGAKSGDILAMTGKLGRGLLWEKTGVPRHLLRILPRISEGRLLAESGAVTSCMDMSDGLSASTHHLAKAGKVGFRINCGSLPIIEGLSIGERNHAVHAGGDYELLFTIDPKKADTLLEKDFGCPVARIGQVTSDNAVLLLDADSEKPLPDKGYEHFRGARP